MGFEEDAIAAYDASIENERASEKARKLAAAKDEAARVAFCKKLGIDAVRNWFARMGLDPARAETAYSGQWLVKGTGVSGKHPYVDEVKVSFAWQEGKGQFKATYPIIFENPPRSLRGLNVTVTLLLQNGKTSEWPANSKEELGRAFVSANRVQQA